MPAAALIRRAGLAVLFAAFSSFVLAQAQNAPAVSSPAYEPHSYQAGKDAVWIPTAQVVVDKMLDMAKA